VDKKPAEGRACPLVSKAPWARGNRAPLRGGARGTGLPAGPRESEALRRAPRERSAGSVVKGQKCPGKIGFSSRPRHERATRVLGLIGFGVIPPGTPGGGWGAAEAATDSPEPSKRGRRRLVRGSAARAVRREGNLEPACAGFSRFAAVLVNRSRLQKPANARALAGRRRPRIEQPASLTGRRRRRSSVSGISVPDTTWDVRGSLARPRSGRKRRPRGALLAASRRSRRYGQRATLAPTKEHPPGASRAKSLGRSGRGCGRDPAEAGGAPSSAPLSSAEKRRKSNGSRRVLVG